MITLNWKNRSPSAEGTRIFRAPAPFDATSLPEPLATVGPGIERYDDAAVTYGERYYYRTQVFNGENTALSSQLEAWALARTGPGPQQLIDGDLEVGYFGEVASVDLINTASLASRFNITGSVSSADPQWMKFAYKGKILFIPTISILYGLSWKSLYDAGLVYGTDDFGDHNLPGLVGVNQRRVITINGENFLVRLLKGKPTRDTPWAFYGTNVSYPAYNTDVLGLEGCEWNDLINRMVNTAIPFTQRKPPFVGAKPTNQIQGNASSWVQEVQSSGKVLVRGQSLSTIGGGYEVDNFGTGYRIYTNSWGDYQVGWRPVLEWLP